MEDQRACIGFEQEILCAPAGAPDRGARHGRDHGQIHRPAQAAIVDDQAIDAPARHVRFDAAAGGFDFG